MINFCYVNFTSVKKKTKNKKLHITHMIARMLKVEGLIHVFFVVVFSIILVLNLSAENFVGSQNL